MADGKSTYGFDFNPSELELQKTIIDGVSSYRIASFKQYEKIVEALIQQTGNTEIKSAHAIYKERLRQEQLVREQAARLGASATQEELERLREATQSRILAEESYQALRIELDKKASKISDRFERQRYKTLSVFERAEYQKTAMQRAKSKKQELELESKQLKAQQSALRKELKTATDDQRKVIEANLALLETKAKGIRADISAVTKSESTAEKEYKILYEVTASHEQKAQDHKSKADEKEKEKLSVAAEALLKISEIENDTSETTKEERDAKVAAVKDEAKKKSDKLEKEAAQERKLAAEEEQAAKNKASWSHEGLETTLKENLGKMADKIGSAINAGLNQITENVNSFYQYQAKVEARLQGSQASYKESLKTITRNVGFSGYIKQKDVINNLVKLVDTGVSYNVDLRAFLATISDKVASTFDVFDSSLLRIIRIQQADTTAARLGMEASLTKLFNEYFSDTSYLSDAFDNVTSALQDASALKSRDDALSFEYVAQKWLGSLYSLGLSDNAANTIAQGLGYIGSGNVDALNNNDSLQTLMAMSAVHGGLSYADLLSGGLTTENTNKLLKGMVTYLKTIAENTDSSVVTKSAYANLFGMSTTDLRSIQNLTENDIANIYAETLSYNDALTELQNQTSQIASRTHISQVLSTVFDNALMSTATTLGSSSGIWGTWMTLNLIEDLTGGINIPSVSVMGNSVDLQTTVTALAKGGIAGLGLMGSLISALASGGGLGASYDLQSWGYDAYTHRGEGYSGISRGVNSGFSASETIGEYTGSASSDDMKSNTLAEGASSAEEDSKITNASTEDNADIYQKIYNAIADDSNSVISRINELHNHIVVDKEAINVNVDLGDSGAMQVSLAGMSDPVKDFYNKLAESVVNGLFSGGDSDIGTETEGTNPMQEAFAKALQSSLNVYITNSYFDNLCQKFGLGGV